MPCQYVKGGATRKKGIDFLAGTVVIEKGNGFKLKKRRFRLDIYIYIYNKSSEALAQVFQTGGGHPIPGDIQCQSGRGSEHLIELQVSTARELDQMAFRSAFQLKAFYDSMIILTVSGSLPIRCLCATSPYSCNVVLYFLLKTPLCKFLLFVLEVVQKISLFFFFPSS